MEVQPIYCAEQIVLPQDLPEVLKNFTKEVIRHDPEDVLQFSALYFDNLAQVSQTLEEVVPPTLDQVRAVHARLGGVSMTQTEAMRAACAEGGGLWSPTRCWSCSWP